MYMNITKHNRKYIENKINILPGIEAGPSSLYLIAT
jgi:hypothetical protein